MPALPAVPALPAPTRPPRRRSRLLLRTVVALVLGPLLLVGLPAHAAPKDKPIHHGISSTKKVKKPTVTKVTRALRIAQKQAGDPYRYGAAGPNAFDCSGLVYYSTHRAGMKGVPRTSSAQAGYARRISGAALRPGDLIFFTSGGRVYHVGIFVGREAGTPVVLHAPRTGSVVHRERVWTSSWFAGTLRGR